MDIMFLMAEKPNGIKYMKSMAEVQGTDCMMNSIGIRDEYRDTALGYLYDYDIMMEDHLPPVYVPKYPKKPTTPVSPVAKPSGIEKTPEPVKEVTPEVVELDTDSPPTKKSPKIGRREDPIFAPKSLFDRPAPALAKLRRDYRAQRYSCRPVSQIPKTTLGPGSITFPIVAPGAQKAPPPPAPADSPDWLIAEDHSLVQVRYKQIVRIVDAVNFITVFNDDTFVSLVYSDCTQCSRTSHKLIGAQFSSNSQLGLCS